MDTESTIVRAIYAAALDEQWQEVVDKVAKMVDATGAFLFTTFVAEQEGGLAVAYGLPMEVTRRFLTEVATVDIWYQELLRRNHRLYTGFTWETDGLIPEDELHRSRFFSDYLVPCDIGRHLGAILGDGTPDQPPLTPLCMYRPVRSKPFSVAEKSIFAALQPHFTQALKVRQRLQASTQGPAVAVLEHVATAVVMLDRNRQILLANPAAEKLFCASGLSLVTHGRLCAAEPSQAAALAKAVEACSTYQFDGSFSLSVRLAGPLGNGFVARLTPTSGCAWGWAKGVAIVFIMQEGSSAIDTDEIMQKVYKLSPAEAKLAKALSEGLTSETFAERQEISVTTV